MPHESSCCVHVDVLVIIDDQWFDPVPVATGSVLHTCGGEPGIDQLTEKVKEGRTVPASMSQKLDVNWAGLIDLG